MGPGVTQCPGGGHHQAVPSGNKADDYFTHGVHHGQRVLPVFAGHARSRPVTIVRWRPALPKGSRAAILLVVSGSQQVLPTRFLQFARLSFHELRTRLGRSDSWVHSSRCDPKSFQKDLASDKFACDKLSGEGSIDHFLPGDRLDPTTILANPASELTVRLIGEGFTLNHPTYLTAAQEERNAFCVNSGSQKGASSS